jgi:Transposase DDE domain/Domain of unknown function (DUF4372)
VNLGQSVFAQLLQFVPYRHFEYLVGQYGANHRNHTCSAWSQFVCMAYAQLTHRHGLRDVAACINSQRSRLYHCGLRHPISRSTLADANERRDWHLFEQLAQRMVSSALALYANERSDTVLAQPLYAMDSTVVDLCLTLFPWAHYRSTKAAIKAHTVLDLNGAIPVMMSITAGNVADVKLLDALQLPAYSLVVLDRGYIDYARLYALTQRRYSFVVRAKSNLQFRCVHAFDCDRSQGIYSDQVIELSAEKARRDYPKVLRRVRYLDMLTCVEYVYLSDRIDLSALAIAQIYRQRWQVELFFKWLKQNLNIQHFFGNSENAVKSQVWIAICVYLAAVMAHKTLQIPVSLHTLLQILEVNLLEKTSIAHLAALAVEPMPEHSISTQRSLF